MSFQIICNSTSKQILGVYTHDPEPEAGQYKREVSDAEYAASLANRGEAVLIDGPNGIAPDPANALADGMVAQWDALTSGVRVMFDPVRAAVNTAVRGGDYATARDIITTVPLPAELETTRTEFLAVIP